MAKIKLEHINKVYPNGYEAVGDLSMEIGDNEFVILVGPSGCGKSTILRMIAGLEKITGGTLYIDGEVANDTEPKDRDLAMVFQNYALYPHWDVYDNIAFGLKLRKVKKEEIDRKVKEALRILDLEDEIHKKPGELSGGQRQRVAMGRALVREPKAFLLDEPLSNLDAKLRVQMRGEIAALHRDLNATFIYVTHDQVEAMTLGTKVAVLNQGELQQFDTPQNLYEKPVNLFTASFIGAPPMNILPGTLGEGCDIHLEGATIPLSDEKKKKVKERLEKGADVLVGIRPEDFGTGELVLPVLHKEQLGSDQLIYSEGFGTDLKIVRPREETVGTTFGAEIPEEKIYLFDPDTEQNILL